MPLYYKSIFKKENFDKAFIPNDKYYFSLDKKGLRLSNSINKRLKNGELYKFQTRARENEN